jgi:ERCC4-related helicase
VAPYLHQKRFEIVVVEKNDSQKEVERILTQMLGPVLERLRLEGALRVFAGIATLTTFQIHKSREEYTKRGNTLNGPIFGYFQAAYKLVELRNDAHQSLGCVKTKILRLRSTPQRGILSTIVKSTDFQNLYQKVMDATGSESDSESILGRNNPKLKKIAELLTEHFERAKATGKSSRAIVFSQFRDSVSEIVELLKNFKPMIRARHFVGQQGSKSSSSAGEGDKRLGGMKQAEQHQVIKLFREDVFNVLICTSIGEEGLDIGQVDLIVNYDTLRSRKLPVD